MNESDRTTLILRYLDEVREQFDSGHAIEHAYRPALKQLVSSFEDTVAVNDPKHSEHGAPDFVFLKKSNTKLIRGYAEAKDITVSLDKTEKSEQMQRYHGYANLFLTDYLEFRFFRNGEKYETISLGEVRGGQLHLTPENGERLLRELEAFLDQTPETIRSGKRLAQIMGGKARRIRDNVAIYLEQGNERDQELARIYEMMKQMLVHDLEPKKFADMYAQTLVYGLFVARYGDETPANFTRNEARDLVPKSNPFLRHFFDHIVGPSFDTRLGYIVDELCEVFSVSNVQEIVHKHLRIQDTTDDAKDPVIHFYEDFLQEYDPLERKRMGAYYTPIPVVKFIIRHVDKILKKDFGISKGLASADTFTKKVDIGQKVSVVKAGNTRASSTSIIDKKFHRVQLLDPAVGTATFLNETIKFIHEQFVGQEGRWPSYVADNLVPRLHGFELMMAPYTIAHLKLGMTLKETGVDKLLDRLGVYLTNTLEEGVPTRQDLFSFGLAEAVSEESQHAAEIKSNQPIMIVMGNPPYSVMSNNLTDYARSLVDKFRMVDGVKIQEKGALRLEMNLNDDYVKFISFGDDMITKNGSGVLAYINNNTWLDSNSHKGMRWHMLENYDDIYIVDLHGDEPDGKNIFDIKTAVSINIFVKHSTVPNKKLATVHRVDIKGSREHKFEQLLNEQDVKWESFTPRAPLYEFVKRDWLVGEEYDKFVSVDTMFYRYSTTILTARDKFAVDLDPNELENRVRDFSDNDKTDTELENMYGLKGNVAWKLSDKRQSFKSKHLSPSDIIRRYEYRPFDSRYVAYDSDIVQCTRSTVMKHVLDKENPVLTTCRFLTSENWSHVLLTDKLVDDSYISNKSKERGQAFPLWLYHDDGSVTPNIKRELALRLLEGLSFKFGNEIVFLHYQEDKIERDYSAAKSLHEKQNVYPTDLLDYIYAILHSPTYRERYKEFLKTDFPRIPKAKDGVEFWRLAQLGNKLRKLHLMESPLIDNFDTTFPKVGDNVVETLKYEDEKVWINQVQYFGNVPDLAWNFWIGGYQPAQKWLKDRKGRPLSDTDLDHYQNIVCVLIETDKVMKQIG